jgi:outer membrane receptor protein involved in Fe transport
MKHVGLAFVVFLLAIPSTVAAQGTTGEIRGSVSSSDGVLLSGVQLAIENADVGFSRNTVSRENGAYRFPGLAPASYQLTASLAGFQTTRRQVNVGLGRTASVDLTLNVGSFKETIVVTDEAPQIDVTSTVSGLSVDSDELFNTIPVQREVTNVALLAPGTVEAPRYWQQAGSTGLFTPEQGFASFNGASIGENSYQINGLNVTNFRQMLGSTFIPMEFVEEVEVKSGGYEAEFGRATGGVINMVTKSGTNLFQGGLSIYYEPENLQSNAPDTYFSNNQDEKRHRLEINASIGGPIVRDRLFFFLFGRYADTSISDLYTVSADVHETSNPYWGGKVDWLISARHRLEGTYISDAVDVEYKRYNYDSDAREITGLQGTGTRSRGGDNYILKYTGMLSDRLLLSAQAGRNQFNRTNASPGDGCPLAIDGRTEPETWLGCWVRSGRGTDWDTRNAVRVDVDLFVGDHQIRAGADYELNESKAQLEYSGGVYYQYEINGDPDNDPETYWFPDQPWDQDLIYTEIYRDGGLFDVNSSAAYLQDSWQVLPNLSLNLGLRWERYENKNSLSETFIETSDQWAPRLGVIWDPSGSGRSKLFASAGIFYLPVASIANIKLAGGVYDEITWNIFDAEINPDGSPSAVGEELFHYLQDGEVPDTRETISDNFKPTSQNEVILGYERMVGSLWTFGVRGVARWLNEVVEDFTIDQGLWTAYGVPCLDPDLVRSEDYCYNTGWRLGNPGTDFEGWYDLDGDGELDRVSISAEDLGYPKAERKYYAVELTIARRFAKNWSLRGSYTWSQTYGNYEGAINSDFGSTWAGLTGTFDTPAMMEYGFGFLPNDYRHNVKLFGYYAWNFGLQLGGNVFWRTGQPINSYGQHPTDPLTRFWGVPSFYTGGEPRPRGVMGRTSNVWSLDLMVRYTFSAVGLEWQVRADVFNVFNNDSELWVQHFAEDTGNGIPQDTYGLPEFYQAPRSVRLGFGLSF